MENFAYNLSYPESGNSSPRSREIDFENPPPWEDHSNQTNHQLPSNYKVKFMCSYGGKIHPRPHDNQLSYIGGETKILAVERNVKFNSLISKLIALCDDDSISFKYQLPGEDLDSLISVTSDDDLEHMMTEYDRLYRISPKPARLRIFVFAAPSQSPSRNSSVRSYGSEEGKSDKDRFVEALNSAPNVTTPPPPPPAVTAPPPPQLPQQTSNVDLLFGFEKPAAAAQPVMVQDPVVIGSDPIQKHIHDLHRLKIEEQQATNYRRKSEEFASSGEYYKVPEKIQPVPVHGGVPYWTEKQVPTGIYPASTDQQIYMIPAPASGYHAQPMMRQVSGGTNQGYYAVQRMPEVYRDQPPPPQQQQQQMYNVIPQSIAAAPPTTLPPQKFSEGFGMMRQTSGGGVVTEPAYGQVAYDMGRQVVYSAPPQVQYHHGVAGGGALVTEAGGKVVAGKATTQASV